MVCYTKACIKFHKKRFTLSDATEKRRRSQYAVMLCSNTHTVVAIHVQECSKLRENYSKKSHSKESHYATNSRTSKTPRMNTWANEVSVLA
jgi:hypothetical protein